MPFQAPPAHGNLSTFQASCGSFLARVRQELQGVIHGPAYLPHEIGDRVTLLPGDLPSSFLIEKSFEGFHAPWTFSVVTAQAGHSDKYGQVHFDFLDGHMAKYEECKEDRIERNADLSTDHYMISSPQEFFRHASDNIARHAWPLQGPGGVPPEAVIAGVAYVTEIVLRPNERTTEPVLCIGVIDKGPGISSPAQAAQKGYTSVGGRAQGYGLGSELRAMDFTCISDTAGNMHVFDALRLEDGKAIRMFPLSTREAQKGCIKIAFLARDRGYGRKVLADWICA